MRDGGLFFLTRGQDRKAGTLLVMVLPFYYLARAAFA